MAEIHPWAIVSPGAQLAETVKVGAFAVVGPNAVLGEDCIIHPHGMVEGYTTLGRGCEVHPFAVVGGRSQDLKDKGGKLAVRVGDYCQFREYVTVNCPTSEERETRLGNHVWILAYSHIAHDCTVGDHTVMSSQSALGGHVQLGRHVNIAWGSAIHQFCRVGDYAMLAGMSKITMDLPPFLIAEGQPGEVRMINKVGLKRNGFSEAEVQVAQRIYKTLYRSGLNRSQAIAALEAGEDREQALVRMTLEFIAASKRGILTGVRRKGDPVVAEE